MSRSARPWVAAYIYAVGYEFCTVVNDVEKRRKPEKEIKRREARHVPLAIVIVCASLS